MPQDSSTLGSSPGRVYRNEAISARAHCFFHQVEALYVDEHVSFADLKQTLLYFAREMFGPDTQIRLRPSYFPFTEPSAEMDISCNLCGGKGFGGKIERGKNVPVILDFRTFGNGESKAGKDVDDLVADNVERMT